MRYEDWAERLAEYYELLHELQFEQGTHDCGLFAAGAIEAMTGVDHIAPYRGKYTSVAGYMKLLKADGFKSVEAYCTSVLGEPIPVLLAQRGDLVMKQERGIEALGICDGASAIFINQDGGLTNVYMDECLKAWRVA